MPNLRRDGNEALLLQRDDCAPLARPPQDGVGYLQGKSGPSSRRERLLPCSAHLCERVGSDRNLRCLPSEYVELQSWSLAHVTAAVWAPFRASSHEWESADSCEERGGEGWPPKAVRRESAVCEREEHGTAENCRETENVSFESVGRAEAFRRSPPSVQVLRSLCPLKTGPLQLGQGRRYTRRCLPPGFSRPCGAR